MKEPIGLEAGKWNIANRIEDREAIGVIEQFAALPRRQRRRQDIVFIADLDTLRRHGTVRGRIGLGNRLEELPTLVKGHCPEGSVDAAPRLTRARAHVEHRRAPPPALRHPELDTRRRRAAPSRWP